jgi:hypothetical protein
MKRLEMKNRISNVLNILNPVQKFEGDDIHFEDESETYSRVSFYTEPQWFGHKCHSFIFEKNPQTGVVDLTYCSRKLFGKGMKRIFKDCTHFGIAELNNNKELVLELTAASCEFSFCLHSIFKLSFDAILNSVNKLIKTVHNEGNWEAQNLSVIVYPLCNILFREQKDRDELPPDLRKNPLLKCYVECENNFNTHAKADTFLCCFPIAEDYYENENEVIATAVHSEVELFATVKDITSLITE